MEVPYLVWVIYIHTQYVSLCSSLPLLLHILFFSLYYFRINTEERVETAKQQVDEPHTQVSTTELEKSEELNAACKTL